jgi:hypothetical protein
VSVFVDGYLDVERAETGQTPEHPGYEQLEGKEDPVIAKVEGEVFNKFTSRHRSICKGQQEPHGALGGKVADIAVQGAFGDRTKKFADEEEGVEVIWPREKG